MDNREDSRYGRVILGVVTGICLGNLAWIIPSTLILLF